MKPEDKTQGPKEEYAIILDVVLDSKGTSFKENEIAQAIGTNTYVLLELVPKPGIILKTNQKVYIGEGKREEIQYIKRTLYPTKLTGSAKSELLFAITEIVKEREKEYVEFFNKAGPISLRKHSLELVSGIGKKHLKELLEERTAKPFENFEDIKKRCTFLPEPAKAIAQRIQDEIEGKDELKFFTRK